MRRVLVVLGSIVAIGCSSKPDVPTDTLPHDAALHDAALHDTPADIAHTPGNPGVGGHVLVFNRLHDPNAHSPLVAAMPTQASGGTVVVSIGRGDLAAFTPGGVPTDNKGNSPYQQLDSTHPYGLYPSSGTAVFAFPSFGGGTGYALTTATTLDDEITVGAVEITASSKIQAVAWNEVRTGTLTSHSVTTTGPATLVAYWWGDADGSQPHTAVPNNGFAVIDSLLEAGSLVQSAMAVRNVDAAGTYNVTWTATPIQGAQMWLIAVQ